MDYLNNKVALYRYFNNQITGTNSGEMNMKDFFLIENKNDD